MVCDIRILHACVACCAYFCGKFLINIVLVQSWSPSDAASAQAACMAQYVSIVIWAGNLPPGLDKLET